MERENQAGTRMRPGVFRPSSIVGITVALLSLVGIGGAFTAVTQKCAVSQVCWDPPYPNMPEFAPPIVRTQKYLPVPDAARGPAIDPVKGYRTQELGGGAFLVTDGIYQMMLIVHADGVIVADAPPSIGAKILDAIQSVAPGGKITHLIYSHAHIDHIGFAGELKKTNPGMTIIAHEETAALLRRAHDANRPVPTSTFNTVGERFDLKVNRQALQLEYPGPNHEPGNIEIYHPASRTLMLVDVVFPGWMMWRRLALAQDVPGYFDVVRHLNASFDFGVLVAGHLNRIGTQADVTTQLEFMTDLHAAAGEGLGDTKMGEGLSRVDLANPWAVFDNYIDRVVIHCVNKLTPKWKDRLAAFDVYIYDQCLSMEQSLRIDGPSM